MTFEERIALRFSLLKQLYDHYFQLGRSKQISLRELNDNVEMKLAYLYLADKQWITMHSSDSSVFLLKITALGIDTVEGMD